MFAICANCNFVPGRYDEWQAAYDDLGEYVWQNEPTTKTYYFGLPLQYWTNHSATTHMFAFEVYTNREALYTTHFNSPAMAKFLSKIPPTMTTGLDLSHYELSSGFLDRHGDKQECEIMVDMRLTCRVEKRSALLEKLKQVARRIEGETRFAGIYTFLVMKSLDNATGIRIFQRFKTWNDNILLAKSAPMLEFWSSSKEEIASMESQAYVPNRKGWLHRGGSSGPASRL